MVPVKQSMKEQEIYQMMLKDLEQFYQKYKFLKISEEAFLEDMKKVTKEGLESYPDDSKISLKQYLCLYYKKRLNNMIHDLLTKGHQHIILSYIETYLTMNDQIESALIQLKKLSNFLKSIDYSINIDELRDLCSKSPILDEILNKIVKDHAKQIYSGKLETIIEDGMTLSIIEMFCNFSNIEIGTMNSKNLESIDYSDSTQMYLSEISFPLLTKEEEMELGYRILAGDKKAKIKLEERNLRFVVSRAKKFQNQGLPFQDLIQEGNIGLHKAVEKFDVRQGVRFISYACYWIDREIKLALLNTSRMIRHPKQITEKIKKYKQAIALLEMQLGKQPSMEEIAKFLGISVEEVRSLDYLQYDPISLNEKIGEDEELENFVSTLEDTNFLEDIIEEDNLLKLDVQNLLVSCDLTEREQYVLKMRFGLSDGKEHSLTEIAKKLHVKEQRVGQIEIIALRKLRRAQQTKELAHHTNNPTQALRYIEFCKLQYREHPKKYRRRMEVPKDFSLEQTLPDLNSMMEHTQNQELKQDYLQLVTQLKNPEFESLALLLGALEAIICVLRVQIGYNTEDIAELCNMTTSKVRKSIKESLELLKRRNISVATLPIAKKKVKVN